MLKKRLAIIYALSVLASAAAGGLAASHFLWVYSAAHGSAMPWWMLICAIMGASLAATLLLTAAFYFRFIKKRFHAPLKHMMQVSDRLATGDRYAMVWPAHDDEIGIVGRNIDRMAEYSGKLLDRLEQRYIEMKNILESIEDGVVVADSSRNVLMINDAAMDLFGLEKRDWTGASVSQAVRLSRIRDEIERSIAEEIVIDTEVDMRPLARRNLNLRIFPFRNQYDEIDGAVVIARDITRLKKLEVVRTEFIESASHELRTPVSLIRGFVETLLSGASDDPKARVRFLDLLDKESRRLMHLTEDILALEQAESKARREPEVFDAAAELRELLKVFDHRIRDKELALEKALPSEPIILYMPPMEFSRIFTNLIDNAVKFTDKGKIFVGADISEGRAVCTVGDTGEGIAEEHLDRLFERFYRVDKSRSRAKGGTGLGLSIVKHLVENNRGKVYLVSKAGAGSTFTIKLPVHQDDTPAE